MGSWLMGHGCLSVDGLFYNYKPFWGYYEPTSIPWDGTRVFVFHGSLVNLWTLHHAVSCICSHFFSGSWSVVEQFVAECCWFCSIVTGPSSKASSAHHLLKFLLHIFGLKTWDWSQSYDLKKQQQIRVYHLERWTPCGPLWPLMPS